MGADPTRQAGGARGRLARISHHFLSEAESPPAPSLLPILLEDEHQDALVYGLAQTCYARGTISRVLHVEPRLRAADSRSSPLYELKAPAQLMRQLEEELSGTKLPPDLCLIPMLDEGAASLAQFSHGVLLVAATPPAVLRGYLRIKRLHAANPAAQVGVVMLSDPARDDVTQLFDRLAAGSRRFLNLDPVLLGRLAGAGGERCRTPHGMLGLADTLIARGFAQAPSAPRPGDGGARRAGGAR